MGIQVVTGPLPVPAQDGLRAARGLGVVENPADPLDPGADWVRGFRFRRTPCKCGTVGNPCNFGDRPAATTSLGFRDVTPFLVRCGRVCTTRGFAAADYAAEAQTLLNAVQYDQIARELWRGDQAKAPDGGGAAWPNPYLADDDQPGFVNLVDVFGNPATDSFSPASGLAAMEMALAQCTVGLRVIHAPAAAVVLWGGLNLLRYEGNRTFTATGTMVIADTGYDGSGPDSLGNAAGTYADFWIYGTGPLQLRLDPVVALDPPQGDFGAAVNRRVNEITYWAEKRAAIVWDCCHIGARIKAATSTL